MHDGSKRSNNAVLRIGSISLFKDIVGKHSWVARFGYRHWPAVERWQVEGSALKHAMDGRNGEEQHQQIYYLYL